MRMKYENGYFTVEAALILPIALLFITMMIFWAFYVYDRSILEHSAYQAALRGTYNHMDASKSAKESQEAAALLVENRVFAKKELTQDVKVGLGKVSVSYHCVVNMPLQPWLGEYIRGFSDDNMTFDITKTTYKLKPAKFIRVCRTTGKLFTSLQDYFNESGDTDE
jgi:aspartyl/asparaginyl-tRNA synthetase